MGYVSRLINGLLNGLVTQLHELVQPALEISVFVRGSNLTLLYRGSFAVHCEANVRCGSPPINDALWGYNQCQWGLFLVCRW